MMPVIRISEITWERLKGHATPLEDSVDDVVNLALDALDSIRGRKSPDRKEPAQSAESRKVGKRRGEKLPQKEFRAPLLQTLHELGGKASTRAIREIMERKMAPRLSDADHQNVSSGDPRWWNAICWERMDLVNEGFFRDDSERGIWELTDKGKAAAVASSKDAHTTR